MQREDAVDVRFHRVGQHNLLHIWHRRGIDRERLQLIAHGTALGIDDFARLGVDEQRHHVHIAVLLHVAIAFALPQIAETMAVFVEGVELHALGQAAGEALPHAGGRKHHVIVAQPAHLARAVIEDLHFGHALFPNRIARFDIVLHERRMFQAVGRQHIGQPIFVFRHRTTINGGTAHVHAFAVGRPRRLHQELHGALRTGGLLHVGEQTKRLLVGAAVAEIGGHVVTAVEHDFGAAGKEAKHLVIIARAQSVAVVRRQSDVTVGRHVVQMFQRGDAARAVLAPHCGEIFDHGLAKNGTREGVALTSARGEGVAVGFAVDRQDGDAEIIDAGVCGRRNFDGHLGCFVVSQRLFQFQDALLAGDTVDGECVTHAIDDALPVPTVEQHAGLPLLTGSYVDLIGHTATHILCRELSNKGIEQSRHHEKASRREVRVENVLHFGFIAEVLKGLLLQSYDLMPHCGRKRGVLFPNAPLW